MPPIRGPSSEPAPQMTATMPNRRLHQDCSNHCWIGEVAQREQHAAAHALGEAAGQQHAMVGANPAMMQPPP